MATENLDGITSGPAAADLSASQYCWGAWNSSRKVTLAALGGVPDGLIHNAPKQDEAARLVTKKGVQVKVLLGGTVAANDKMSCLANGKSVKSVTSGHALFGKFLQAGVAGDIVEAQYDGFIGSVP